MMVTNHGGVLFMRALATLMLVLSWAPVFNPKMKVHYGRGANRPLMSRKSNLAFAVAFTGWSWGVFVASGWPPGGFGSYSNLAFGLFATGFAAALFFVRQDVKEHEARMPPRKPPAPKDWWLALCGFEAVLLPIVLSAMIRDHFRPPVSDEQKSVHAMGMVLVILLSLGAAILYGTRPRGNQEPR